MKLYKLTNQDMTTRGPTLWGEGVTHEAPGLGPLCSSGWLHAYLSPELAVFLNPIHADIANPILWEAEGEIGARDGQLKVGCAKLTTLRQLPLPQVTTEQRVKFAILCAKAVCTDAAWNAWADAWLDGSDRSQAAAWASRAAAGTAAGAAMEA